MYFSLPYQDANKIMPRYLEGQVITGKMRAILIDWLVQVHLRFTLLQETLYLTVAIIDRFLQVTRGIDRWEVCMNIDVCICIYVILYSPHSPHSNVLLSC